MQEKSEKSRTRTARRYLVIRLAGVEDNGDPRVIVDAQTYANYQGAAKALTAEFGTTDWPATVAITEREDAEHHANRFAALVKTMAQAGGLAQSLTRRQGVSLANLVKAQAAGHPFVLANTAPLVTVNNVRELTGWPEPGDGVSGDDIARIRHLQLLFTCPKFARMKTARESQTDDYPMHYALHPEMTRHRTRFIERYGVALRLDDFLAVTEDDGPGAGYGQRYGAFYRNTLALAGYHAMKPLDDGLLMLARRVSRYHVALHIIHHPEARREGPVIDWASTQ